jgi:hypothetical protein
LAVSKAEITALEAAKESWVITVNVRGAEPVLVGDPAAGLQPEITNVIAARI